MKVDLDNFDKAMYKRMETLFREDAIVNNEKLGNDAFLFSWRYDQSDTKSGFITSVIRNEGGVVIIDTSQSKFRTGLTESEAHIIRDALEDEIKTRKMGNCDVDVERMGPDGFGVRFECTEQKVVTDESYTDWDIAALTIDSADKDFREQDRAFDRATFMRGLRGKMEYRGVELDKVCEDENCEKFYFEKCFDLDQDKSLNENDIVACARVYTGWRDRTKNRIVFKKKGEDREGTIDCVHTAIYEIGAEDFDPGSAEQTALDMAKSSETRLITLAPEEHFFALQSFVQGVAEVGVFGMMRSGYFEGGEEPPFGFNSEMRSQVITALRSVDPGVMDNEVLKFLDEVGKNPERTEWLIKAFPAIDSSLGIMDAAARNPTVYEKLKDVVGDRYHRVVASVSESVDESLFSD